jgi:S1-C subfamily serine protease
MAIFLLATGISAPKVTAANSTSIPDAIVKIYVAQGERDYCNPWNRGRTVQISGSGALIKGKKILTNAHVVSDGTFIEVLRQGQTRRYTAHVANISHTADLAVLTVDDDEFFKGAPALPLGSLPESQQEIFVYGFPMGGETMSITKGVVSRIEHQVYTHSGQSLLAVQIDAAINPGNSGGPAISNGRIAGVAMQAYDNSANSIGYIVPAPIIEHFLRDIADGRQDGFPSLGILYQPMENPGMKRSLGVPMNQDGVVIAKIYRNSPAHGLMQPGDVVTRLDNQPVAGDGTVSLSKNERTALTWAVQKHQMGETLKVDFLRHGQPLSGTIMLTNNMTADYLVQLDRYDVMPTYYVCGGLVFCPLEMNFLKAFGANWMNDAPKHLTAYLTYNCKDDQIDEVVFLQRVLACDLNRGFHDIYNCVVKKVNGHEIRNLRELITAVENNEGPFVTFENTVGQKIVLDRERMKQEQDSILRTYGIPSDRSEDLQPAIPRIAQSCKH